MFFLYLYLFLLPQYTLIGLALIPLLFQDSVSVDLTMDVLLCHKVSIVQPLLST